MSMKIGKDEIGIIKQGRVSSSHTDDGLIEELLIFLREPRTIDEIQEAFPITKKKKTILKD